MIEFLFRKYFNQLRSSSIGDDRQWLYNQIDPFKIRHEVCCFLTFLKRHLHCLSSQSNDNHLYYTHFHFILKELKLLLAFVGRISSLGFELFSSSKNSSIYNYIHIYYDIWWSAIEIIYLIQREINGNIRDFSLIKDEITTNYVLQIIKLLLNDIISLCYKKFNKLSFIESISSSPFLCCCVKELIIMMRLIVDSSDDQLNDNKFQVLFNEVIKLSFEYDKLSKMCHLSDFTITQLEKSEKVSIFLVWLSCSFSCVFKYNLSGKFDESKFAPNSFLMNNIGKVLKDNESNLKEKDLSAILFFCLHSINNINPAVEIILLYIEFFIKKLNSLFLSNNIMENIQILPKSSNQWLNQIRTFHGIKFSLYHNESSLKLFFCFVSNQLSRISNLNDNNSELQKFKSELIVNLQLKNLEKLDEVGFYNLLTFILIIIETTKENSNDLIDKLMLILEELTKRNKSFKSFELTWKFLFSILHKKLSSETKVIHFIVKQLKTLSLECDSKTIPIKDYNKLFLFYLEEVESLIELSKIGNSNLIQLLSVDFAKLFSQLNHSNSIIKVLNNINFLLDYILKMSTENRILLTSFINSSFELLSLFIKSNVFIDVSILANVSSKFVQ